MGNRICAVALALLMAVPALRAGEEAKEASLSLTKAMEQVEALRTKVTYDMEGATLADAIGWLDRAGVSVVFPASLRPREGETAPTVVVKVKDIPLGMVVDQFLVAADYKYDVKVAMVDGQAVCLVAISVDAAGGMFRQLGQRFGMMGGGGPGPFMAPPGGGAGFGRGGPGGGQQRGQGGQGGGPRGRGGPGNNANNPNQPADPGDPF